MCEHLQWHRRGGGGCGERQEFDSGMVRDAQEGKPRFDLLLPEGIPYEEQMLTRLALLLARGAQKYSDRNWEKARGKEELDRAKASAFRHLMQWLCDEDDEDHAAAVMFNLALGELVRWKMDADAEVTSAFATGDAAFVTGDTAELMHELPRGTRVVLLRVDPSYREQRVWLIEDFGTALRAEVAEKDLAMHMPPVQDRAP
ncbi:DUF5664 domain-containing protein [Micromonospora sp. WMMA1363]|uniref:dATP/dGTP diphosphohydrolase domain-containing protein n=1 Tax=Micromonospora sp. WMMA1363 TaxID=3053985 RepID=UPI00259CCD9C|nr:dATP/dGTP diphosphohydrolase domain-containing protein [Micromonospora sp. WMMA1363]MDM4719804.1 DUF5664 domain-containing protein [Micromonospora sp. WMMA1363]